MIDKDPRIAIENLFGTGIDIHWYGVIIAFALLVGVILGVMEAKRRGYRAEMVLDFMLIAIPVCIIFARLYYVIFAQDASGANPYWSNPASIIAIWNGGLAIYGAVIGGVVSAIIFFKWTRVRIGTMMDIAAPSLIIAQAIGRWGNFVNQEAHGEIITNPKWQWFPAAVEINGTFYQATFFYEFAWNVIVFIVLMALKAKIKIRGGVFALYLIGYGIGRFFIESLRTDSLWWGTFRVSQVLSAVLVIGGVLYLIFRAKDKNAVLEYKGVYDATLTTDEINEFKANAKKMRAQEKAESAQRRADTLEKKSNAAEDKVKKAKEKAEAAKKNLEKFEEEIKISEIMAQVDEDATEEEKAKAKKAKEKAEKLTEKSEAAKEKVEKVEDKVKKAETTARRKELKATEAEGKAIKKEAKAKKAEIKAAKASEKVIESIEEIAEESDKKKK